MFFGNTEGILEFDGVSWRKLILPGNSPVRSLALDRNGRVYAGGQNEVGYLETTPLGVTRFVSLLDRLDPEERKFGDVWSILTAAEGVYFGCTDRLILITPNAGVRTWKAPSRLRRTLLLEGVIFPHVSGKGLYQLRGEELVLAPGGEIFANLDVRGFFRHPRGLVLATSNGFFLKTDTGFSPLQSEAAERVGEFALYSVSQIQGDVVALGTARGGIILATPEGKVLRQFRKEDGLPSEYIASLATDRQGGTWLATGGGIVRFQPRFTEFGENSGLRGSLLTLARWRGQLFAGTTSGLFRLTPRGGASAAVFQTVPGLQETVWALLAGPDSLFVGAQSGLYEYRDGKTRRLEEIDLIYDLAFAPGNQQRLFLAGRFGALVLEKQGNLWRRTLEVPNKSEEFRTIAEDAKGRLWASTLNTVLRITPLGAKAEVKTYTEKEGLPTGWKNVFRVGQQLYFGTEKGLLRPDEKEERFVADASLGTQYSSSEKGVLLLRGDADRLWVSGSGNHTVLQKNTAGKYEADPMPLLGAGLQELWVLQLDADGVVWASGPDGYLVRYDPSLRPRARYTPPVLVRRLRLSDSRESLTEKEFSAKDALRLPYTQNSLRFEFALPFYDAPNMVEYQTSNNSASTAMSLWSNEPWKDLANLWEGDYRFQVRARTPYGQVAESEEFPLQVAPPWTRTWWAYSLYALLGSGLVYLFVRWRIRALRESNILLERTVEERTAEIRRQRDQIYEQEQQTEALLLNILPAKVAEELRVNGKVEPMYFDDVTVCFTDFVGFTVSSEKVAAGDIVAALHEYFTAFDEIISRYGLEKLKTIGDSYMFAAGLPQVDPEHAVKAVRAALEIVEKASEIAAQPGSMPWRLRVGLHSGPVAAGVVGHKKFAFDIWGDTVNLASRMESSGLPGRVNFSQRTFEAVRHAIACEARGPVRTKDGRDLEMYLAALEQPVQAGQTAKA